MESRREFLKKATLLSAGTGLSGALPLAIQKALAINPDAGTTFLDAEHVVFLMQENRSFDHTYGSLQGVRGFNDPRAIDLPNKNKVWLQTDADGNTYAPFRTDIKNTKATWMSSLPHAWNNQVDARNNGDYDKWLIVKRSDDFSEMPLTLGYYTREDIPFYYSLADAFTVCDQHFCSSLTGTTPNRLFFWTGTIRNKQEADAKACVWNEDADLARMVSWKTFPEVLEENNVSWKIYQNEICADTGLNGEERSWLSNYGDNCIEYLEQFYVKFSQGYIDNLPKTEANLKGSVSKLTTQLQNATAEKKAGIENKIKDLQSKLEKNLQEQKLYTRENYEKLTPFEKSIHAKAFVTNKGDANYRTLEKITYENNNTTQEVLVPKGDILHQFRQDVKNGELPAVSWIVAPENFSDHPSSAWYGAWYISEVFDILTQNPEVWKKTIFVLTYDENDGYFDHVPPFTSPDPADKNSGRCVPEIPTGVDYVKKKQQSAETKNKNRESPIGLGYRVPLVIASPWSRGGCVNSEVFDHTSSLQFLEKFLTHKTKKKIQTTNISPWRRMVCGDLSSVFKPYRGEKIPLPTAVERNAFVQSIHEAKFKEVPKNFHALNADEINIANTNPKASAVLPRQEKGTRPASALCYEPVANGYVDKSTQRFKLTLGAGNTFFKKEANGIPFNVYARGYKNEKAKNRAFAVGAGYTLTEDFSIHDFTNGQYHLEVYGPNGFFRKFLGNANEPSLTAILKNETAAGGKPTGHAVLEIVNNSSARQTIRIKDISYGHKEKTVMLLPKEKKQVTVQAADTAGWYDVLLTIQNANGYAQQFAGKIETGRATTTDPAMGNR